MDINTLIAQASAPHMQAVATAHEAFRKAVKASEAAGFRVVLRVPEASYEKSFLPQLAESLVAVTDDAVVIRLEYKATIQEKEE